MKKIIIIIICIFISLGLTGCNKNNSINNEIDNSVQFVGTIKAIHSNMILVEPKENTNERKITDRFMIETSNTNVYQLGTIVNITYDGKVDDDAYPIHINVSKIDIVDLGNLNIGKKSDIKIQDNEIVLKVKEDTLTNEGATFLLINNSNKTFTYGYPYSIEVNINGDWYNVDVDKNFILPAFQISGNSTKEIEIDWIDGYGKLPAGKYRLLKNVDHLNFEGKYDTYYVGAEFNIN